jgi:hypothetical protein
MFTSERENRQQSEVISSLRSEKDSLESALYESQQSEQQLTVRKEQLEGENQELILRKENLQSKLPLLRSIDFHYSVLQNYFGNFCHQNLKIYLGREDLDGNFTFALLQVKSTV